MMWSKIK